MANTLDHSVLGFSKYDRSSLRLLR